MAENWINKAAQDGEHLGCRIRHGQTIQKCRIHYENDKSHLSINFDQSQRAAAAGQSAVLYRDRECLGGCIIVSS